MCNVQTMLKTSTAYGRALMYASNKTIDIFFPIFTTEIYERRVIDQNQVNTLVHQH